MFTREIIPGVFQSLAHFSTEQQCFYLVKRNYGNYMIYAAIGPIEQLYPLIESQGGVYRYFHHPVDDQGAAEQLFKRYGCYSVFSSHPGASSNYPWESFQEMRSLYRGMDGFSTESMPNQPVYVINQKGIKLLFSGELLYLDNGHWKMDLPRKQAIEFLTLLEGIDFDFLLPKYVRGPISFQQVESSFKEYQLNALKDGLSS